MCWFSEYSERQGKKNLQLVAAAPHLIFDGSQQARGQCAQRLCTQARAFELVQTHRSFGLTAHRHTHTHTHTQHTHTHRGILFNPGINDPPLNARLGSLGV
jgi:hypothetical protein